jgi:hypothetical protein
MLISNIIRKIFRTCEHKWDFDGPDPWNWREKGYYICNECGNVKYCDHKMSIDELQEYYRSKGYW